MLKHTILAASLAAVTMLPLPVVTGSVLAQRTPSNCTAGAACNPNKTPGVTETYRCSDELGYLRRVYEEELEAIEDPLLVSIVPICMGESYGVMRADGNAGALRQTIADNDAMMEALFDKNFRYDDVVGIRMTGEESLILFVHPLHNYR